MWFGSHGAGPPTQSYSWGLNAYSNYSGLCACRFHNHCTPHWRLGETTYRSSLPLVYGLLVEWSSMLSNLARLPWGSTFSNSEAMPWLNCTPMVHTASFKAHVLQVMSRNVIISVETIEFCTHAGVACSFAPSALMRYWYMHIHRSLFTSLIPLLLCYSCCSVSGGAVLVHGGHHYLCHCFDASQL